MSPSMHLHAASRTRPCHGFVANGDRVVLRKSGEHVLLGVVDALGHGPHAEEVARHAESFLQQVPLLRPDPAELLLALHRELRGSRGAAATLCCFDGHALHSAGVGNVAVRGLGVDPGLVCAPGVLGGRLRRVQAGSVEVSPGVRFALFSDGISARVDLSALRALDPAAACDLALATFGRPTDDATILIFDVQAA